MKNSLIEVRDLVKHYPVKGGLFRGKTIGFVKAVDGVSFSITQGETFALVGESGCGKTTLANLILKLIEPTSGQILFQGNSVSSMASADTKAYRRTVQAVFQDPYGALNPRMRVGHIIDEPLEVHGYPKAERTSRVKEALRSVGLPVYSEAQFPHEFSGGQRQRIGIARALTLDPSLIVLDEPVSSLDVSIRSQVLNLLKDIQDQRGISYLLISHDLASVEHMSHTVGVMYLGKLVELGDVEEVCANPGHPYTASLVAAATPPGRTPPWHMSIVGEVPSALEAPPGCAFHPRCPYAMPACSQETPLLTEVEKGRWVACHLYPDHIDGVEKGKRAFVKDAESPVAGEAGNSDT